MVDPGIPTFVLGHFNTVFDRSVDRRGSDPFNDARESSLALRDFSWRCCVVDIWRDLHRLTPGFTSESQDRARASRIDLIGCPSVWAPFVSFCFRVLFPITRPSISRSVYLSPSHEGRAGGNVMYRFLMIPTSGPKSSRFGCIGELDSPSSRPLGNNGIKARRLSGLLSLTAVLRKP